MSRTPTEIGTMLAEIDSEKRPEYLREGFWKSSQRRQRYELYTHLSHVAFRQAMDAEWMVPEAADGKPGHAWVTLRDGRSSFAYWARNQKLFSGREHVVVTDPPHLDLAIAHARAYAEALTLAGIPCTAGWCSDDAD
jgi:hypothetical protein